MTFSYRLIFLLCIVVSIKVRAQEQIQSQSFETFLFKGSIKNSADDSLNLYVTGFFEDTQVDVPIAKDGTFKTQIPIDGEQDIHLRFGWNILTLYVKPGDTIDVKWDGKDLENTFSVHSPVKYRDTDLQLNWKLYKRLLKDFMSLQQTLNTEKSDSVMYQRINDFYNRELQEVMANPLTQTADRFIFSAYFRHANLLRNHKLLGKYSLKTDKSQLNPDQSDLVNLYLPNDELYLTEYDRAFYECPEYRNYLFGFVHFPLLRLNTYMRTNTYTQEEDVRDFAPMWENYYRALSELHIIPIRDWFMAKSIMQGFRRSSFQECEDVMNAYLTICKTQKYKDILNSYYSSIKGLRPGSPAPDFTLKDADGGQVSLSNYKGKVVYIDFWGVGCAPCIYDIQHSAPKLHERYHNKDVVFINICVDADESAWKKAIAKYNVDGVNLLAEGWTKNEVCKKYNISGIPHYVLIDKEGRIVNPNAPQPFTQSVLHKEIDGVLEK